MAQDTMARALGANFLGHSPTWYKLAIVGFLLVNPVLMITAGPFVTGWVLILEFIFCLAMALKCYPLQPGGLLAIEAVVIGLTNSETVYEEIVQNFPVLLLLMFMVAGIYFLKELLLYSFTRILLSVESKVTLSLLFSAVAAILSAFLDALTVTAVIITVAQGFYLVYHRAASGKSFHQEHDVTGDDTIVDGYHDELEQFRAFLRSLMMHAAVGTALGGVSTMVGGTAEPAHRQDGGLGVWRVLPPGSPGIRASVRRRAAHLLRPREAAMVQLWRHHAVAST